MTELFVSRTNSLLQGNGREHKSEMYHSWEPELSGQLLESNIVKYCVLHSLNSVWTGRRRHY